MKKQKQIQREAREEKQKFEGLSGAKCENSCATFARFACFALDPKR
jgi:hypothetical protein